MDVKLNKLSHNIYGWRQLQGATSAIWSLKCVRAVGHSVSIWTECSMSGGNNINTGTSTSSSVCGDDSATSISPPPSQNICSLHFLIPRVRASPSQTHGFGLTLGDLEIFNEYLQISRYLEWWGWYLKFSWYDDCTQKEIDPDVRTQHQCRHT